MKRSVYCSIIICLFFLLSACGTNVEKKTEETPTTMATKTSEVISSTVGKPSSPVTIGDIHFDESLPLSVGGGRIIDTNAIPPNTMKQIIESSPEIVEVTVLDEGRQVTIKGRDGGYFIFKAKIEKVYKGSKSTGDIINYAEEGSVEQMDKFGEKFNVINLPLDNSEPFQTGDRAILFIRDYTDFSKLFGQKTYMGSVLFFSKFVIDSSSNTVQLGVVYDSPLSEFSNIPIKTKKMRVKKFKNAVGTLEYKEMEIQEFLNYLPKNSDE